MHVHRARHMTPPRPANRQSENPARALGNATSSPPAAWWKRNADTLSASPAHPHVWICAPSSLVFRSSLGIDTRTGTSSRAPSPNPGHPIRRSHSDYPAYLFAFHPPTEAHTAGPNQTLPLIPMTPRTAINVVGVPQCGVYTSLSHFIASFK